MGFSSRAKVHLLVAALLGLVIALARSRPPETAPEVVSRPESGVPVNNGYPALACGMNGDVWLAWVSARLPDPLRRGTSGDSQPADQVMLKRRAAGGAWSKELRVSVERAVNSDPALACEAGGCWIVWSCRQGGDFDLFARRVDETLALSEPVRLTAEKGADAAPKAATAPDGAVWIVWESFREGRNRVYAMSGQRGAWRAPALVSAADSSAFRPALAISEAGVVTVVWDGGNQDRYRVFLRQWNGSRWGDIQQAPTPDGFDAYAPKVAADQGARVWMVYAQNSERTPEWGLRGWRPGPMPRPAVRALVWDGERWQLPPARAGSEPGLVAGSADMPDVVLSSRSAPLVVFIRFRGHMNIRLWETHWLKEGWSEPQQLDVGEEEYSIQLLPGAAKQRMDQRPALLVQDNRVLMAYERGTGTFQNRQIAVREFPAAAAAADPALFSRAPAPAPSAPVAVAEKRPSADYNTYFGDIHTHLLMDDGWSGTPDQFFTFARDRRLLDFASYTPHAESNKLLASEIALVQRLAAAFNQPGRFVAIPGWEWTQGDFRVPQEGHKHILNETDDQPFFSATEADSDSARELQRLMKGTTGLMFAHHVSRGYSGGTNFEILDPSVEPDIEIASHWGRFEFYDNPGHIRDQARGCSVQDAWSRGLKVGVVGGSDNHDLFVERMTALTAVLARSLDRRSIFDALRNRRCYATTGEKIRLEVWVNGQPMGSVISVAAPPLVKVKVSGTEVLEKVEVVKFSRGTPPPFPTAYAVAPGAREAAFEWKDLAFSADAAYYVRVTQRADPRISGKTNFGAATGFPNEMAWSSPVWVSKQ